MVFGLRREWWCHCSGVVRNFEVFDEDLRRQECVSPDPGVEGLNLPRLRNLKPHVICD